MRAGLQGIKKEVEIVEGKEKAVVQHNFEAIEQWMEMIFVSRIKSRMVWTLTLSKIQACLLSTKIWKLDFHILHHINCSSLDST